MSRITSIVAAILLTAVLVVSSITHSLAQSENVVLFLHGTGDDVIQIPDLGVENLLVARIHANPFSSHFSATTYDAMNNYTSLLVNTTDAYMGIVPFNFDTYDMQDVSNGLLEIKSEGDWTIEIITLGSLPPAQNTQVLGGVGDYVGYVKGSSSTAVVTGNKDGQHFFVSAIGMNQDSGNGELLVNTTSVYEGTVRLPVAQDGYVLIIKAVGFWGIGFNTTDVNNKFFTIDTTLKLNPYSPFKEQIEKLTPTSPAVTTTPPSATPVATAVPASITDSSIGVVNRDANLRSGPGTTYAIAGSAKSGDKVTISGANADGSWLELVDGEWIAAFLVDVQVDSSPTSISLTPTATIVTQKTATATKKATVAPSRTPVPTRTPTPAPTNTVAASAATAAPTLTWYAGGTLHDATVADWRTAEERNRLATAADWAAVGFDLDSIAEYEVYAPQLIDCIEESIDEYAQSYSESAPMRDLATICVILIKG